MWNPDSIDDKFDILDQDWNFTWKIKNWLDIHKDWDWHGAVHLWIFNNKNQILIRKRPSSRFANPSKWDVGCWWHIFPWDNGLDTAIKKALSQLGIVLNEKNLKFLFTLKDESIFNSGTYIDNEIFSVFSFNVDTNKTAIKPKKELVEEFKFIDVSELKENILNKNPNFIIRQNEFKKILNFL